MFLPFFSYHFFFLFSIIKDKNVKKMKSRLERLAIPYFCWPIFIWSLNNILFLLFQKSIFGFGIPFIKLKEQLIIGRIFLVHFWFLFNLLFFTIIFFILSLIFKLNCFLKIIEYIAILSYVLQYSKYNYFFFDRYKECVSHSLGHFVESFPIAITAFILKYSDILVNLLDYRNIVIFYCIIFNYFIYHYDIFTNIEIFGKKYNYNGFDKNLFAFFSFIGFYLIPFDKFQYNYIIKIIKLISNYTQGIYCLHPIIISFATKILHLQRTFQGCIIIYILSYFVSFVSFKFCCIHKLRYLFI